jgi:hypothetical protein
VVSDVPVYFNGVKYCCEAGAVAYPSACPWHEVEGPQFRLSSDERYDLLAQRGRDTESNWSLTRLDHRSDSDRVFRGLMIAGMTCLMIWLAFLILIFVLIS